jgi:8-oxo-dGTP diphosphatase
MKEVSVGIILRDGKVLACQRKRTAKYPLKWEFPGGKIESGESPREALVRELYEELHIQVSPNGEFHCQEWKYGDASYRVHYFLIHSFTGDLINKAFEDVRWVEPLQLSNMDILEGNRDAIDMLPALASAHASDTLAHPSV